MGHLLGRLNISNFDAQTYINKNADNVSDLPNIAIAASGGGYRAMLNGAGAVAAFDSRTENSTGPGQLGGLLQSATYFSGLSGGSWLVGSIYLNNFTSIQAILSDSASGLWNLDDSILQGPATVSNYYSELINTVSGKTDAGFNDSITDYWLVSTCMLFWLTRLTLAGAEHYHTSSLMQRTEGQPTLGLR
jgi:lysophospholipase